MSYLGFLAVFVVIPIALLWLAAIYDFRRGVRLPDALRSWPAPLIVCAHVTVAILYTTPWDNYLVATRVWWYDPKLVVGIVLWFVPIEEYIFFALQTLLCGSWLLLLARHYPEPAAPIPRPARLRVSSTLAVFALWLMFVGILAFGWRPGTYLALLFVWALVPAMIQVAFGADILWRRRRIILLSILPMTLYLAAADKLAITSGTWTISPDQSIGIKLLGRLPLEELLFFFMTNTLITLGITLVMSQESKNRAVRYLQALMRLFTRPSPRTNDDSARGAR